MNRKCADCLHLHYLDEKTVCRGVGSARRDVETAPETEADACTAFCKRPMFFSSSGKRYKSIWGTPDTPGNFKHKHGKHEN